MRGSSSILVAFGLLGFAAWTYLNHGVNTAVVGATIGGGFFLFQAYRGIGFSPIGDATTPMEFISNPAGTAFDCATDQLQGLFEDADDKQDDKPAFDPDAIIAKYLENRPVPPPEHAATVASPSRFGRKGL